MININQKFTMKKLLSILFIFCGCVYIVNAQTYTEHTVKKGETKSSIAKEYSIRKSTLIKCNPEFKGNRLCEGDIISIPSPEWHIVSEGETLQSIAEIYDIPVSELFARNPQIKSLGMSVGSEIWLPNVGNTEQEPLSDLVEEDNIISNLPLQDVLYLKNGSVIKGEILENNLDNIKIQTFDRNIFIYTHGDVDRCEKETMTHTVSGKKILDLPKHTFGVRGGALFTTALLGDLLLDEETKDYTMPGFHLGATYELSLGKTNRWCFQTGLDFQLMQGKYSSSRTLNPDFTGSMYSNNGQLIKTKAMYLDIPILLSCKFQLHEDVLLYPTIGFSYSLYSDFIDSFISNDSGNLTITGYSKNKFVELIKDNKKLRFVARICISPSSLPTSGTNG